MPTLEERRQAALAQRRAQPDLASQMMGVGEFQSPTSDTGEILTLEQRRQRVLDSQNRPSVSGSPFGQMTASRFLGNVANVPDVAAGLSDRALNAAALPAQYLGQGLAALDTRDFSQFQAPEPVFNPPPLGADYVSGPSGDDLMGAVQRVGEGAAALRTGDFSQFHPDPAENQRQRIAQLREENPSMAMAANISGDVLTLLAGRAPLAKGRALNELQFAKGSKTAAEASARLRATSSGLAEAVPDIALSPTVSAALQTISKGKNFKWLANRVGRSAEAGLEGLFLSALNGQADPYTTAGITAATQAGSSLLLGGVSKMLSGGTLGVAGNLVVASAIAGGAVQLLKSGTLGGDDYILPSLESGFNKTLIGLGLGTVAMLAGQGRITGGLPVARFPEVMDMITSIGRGTYTSLVTEMSEDPAVNAVLTKISQDPEYFTPAQMRRLDRARIDSNVSFSETINDMMNDRDFAQKFERLR